MLFFKIISLLLILLSFMGCTNTTKMVFIGNEMPVFHVDDKGDVTYSDSDDFYCVIPQQICEQVECKKVQFQQNHKFVINLSNGSSLVLNSWSNQDCQEFYYPIQNECEEEMILANLCQNIDNSTIICSSDSVYYRIDMEIAKNKEFFPNHSALKIKKIRISDRKQSKSLQSKLVLSPSDVKKPY